MSLKEIPGYTGLYALDDQNRVVSVPRIVKHPFSGFKRKVGGKVLATVASRNREPVYRLSKNGQARDIPLRRILEMVNDES